MNYGFVMAEHEESSPVEQVFAGGTAQNVGWFRYFFDDDRWEWSPEVERIHGYSPGTANPTTELVLSHKHPDDYSQIAATLSDIRRTHEPFSTRHRIITKQGQTRDVVVIGQRLQDGSGDVVGTQGFYIDATPRSVRESEISDRVAEISENRSVIDQAKGVLMFVYRIDADTAFQLLCWRSQETNSKLRDLAEQLLNQMGAFAPDPDSSTFRQAFDHLLMHLHYRADA
jgi:PAS domain S-box-containing protein